MRILVLFYLLLVSNMLFAEQMHELKIVKQVYNINANSPDMMYQFVPDYMQIKAGDTVKFTGTVGRHTAHSVRDMMPEGFKKISIMPRQPDEVLFDKPGIYGVHCKLHERHGMVALIVVGGNLHNMEKSRTAVDKWISKSTRPKMHKLLDKAEKTNGKLKIDNGK